jgi:hypothetical protein
MVLGYVLEIDFARLHKPVERPRYQQPFKSGSVCDFMLGLEKCPDKRRCIT